MKRIVFALIMLAAMMNVMAQEYQMQIKLNDGRVVDFDVADIESIMWNEKTSEVHEYVDLGLSVKWATCNVGANSPEEYGDCYAWGETEPKEVYDWLTYKYCNGSYDTMTKYCTDSSYGTVDHKWTLDPEDDVAHVKWGGDWRMPTKAEQDELRNNCTWTWTTQNGVKGFIVTGSNGNFIFLPATGSRCDSIVSYVDLYGFYWSSTLYTWYSNGAYSLNFYSDSGLVDWSFGGRMQGYSVRPVCSK